MLDYSKPPESLALELQEVARDAAALFEHLKGSNYLPSTFPKNQLSDIAGSLIGLPEGTAEGCRAALEYARNRLPFIRRENILSVQNSPLFLGIDAPPTVTRGDFLDQKVRDLIASVTTALDEYRRLASEEGEDEFESEASVVPHDELTLHSMISGPSLNYSNYEI
jgi:hypothetical protein